MNFEHLEELAQKAYDLLPYRDGTGWHWSGYVDAHPRLCLSAWVSGYGRCTVMDFDRWGMQSAQPRFPDHAMMMQYARDLVTFEVGNRGVVGVEAGKRDASVYRLDVDGIDHPIPQYMAAADPQTILSLIAQLREAHEKIDALTDTHVSAMAPHDTRCTFAAPCAECAADLALLGNHPDPYATIARRP